MIIDKTKVKILQGPGGKPLKKSLLPCHVKRDDKRFPQYLELIKLMQMPDIERMIFEKIKELKISAKFAIDKFFQDLGRDDVSGN